MAARPDLADRVHRLSVLGHVDALGEVVQDAKLVGVHHEFLEAGDQAAFQPAAAWSMKFTPESSPMFRLLALS